MGFRDVLLGRSKPIRPDLDQLFALPSAAITLQAAIGFTSTGAGSARFAAIEGGAFTQVQQEVRALLNADSEHGVTPVEFSRDTYGYSWLLSRRPPDELPALVGDLHAVNTSLQDSGFGPHLLCSLVTFPDAELRPLALVHLYKRGTFYPFAPLPRNKRDNPLELQIKAALKDDLRIEENLSRWFPLRGAPGSPWPGWPDSVSPPPHCSATPSPRPAPDGRHDQWTRRRRGTRREGLSSAYRYVLIPSIRGATA